MESDSGSDRSRREYEFDEHENNTLSDLAGAMRAVGKLLIIIGPVRVILGMVTAWHGDYGSGVAQAVEGVCFFLIGNWTESAADAYQRIVTTRGTDITHLMNSMVDLKKIYNLQRTVLSIALAAMVLGGVVLILGSFGGGTKDKAKETGAPREDRPAAPVAAPVVAPPPPAAVPAAAPVPVAADPAVVPTNPADAVPAVAAPVAKGKLAKGKHGKKVTRVRKRR